MTESPFFVKRIIEHKTEYVDINTGMIADPLDIAYSRARHGLCKKYGVPVYKKLKNDGFKPLVFIARETPKPARHTKTMRVTFLNAEKVHANWELSPWEQDIIEDWTRDGKTPRQIAVHIGSPVEAIENALEKIGGERNGAKRNNAARERKTDRTRVTARR